MHEHQTTARRRLMGAAACIVLALVLTSCFTGNQTKMVSQINASRRAYGKPALAADMAATRKAQSWAQHMADTGRLEHSGGGSSLSTAGLPKWCAVGENVGMGSTTQVVQDAYMRSAPHKANILGNYNRVGTGVVRKNGTVWSVQVFYRSC
ncbi:CAP domain-containing protein [Aquihabitans sp. McL0605]|uniref:CAP domain-containing protein n=1 Tax=Aquihabitans sp. McL0605 TaxID=3415671 RepID=UPI003CF23C0B